MPACSPQRYLANNRNLVRTALLTPSSVEPVTDNVLELPVGRLGTAQVVLDGLYTGVAEATYDVEVTDTIVTTAIPSAPVAAGAGSGTLTGITATAVAAQSFTVQLANAGIPTLTAGIDFEGVRIVARQTGSGGNDITLTIDQAALVFTPQPFSLLADLRAGSGGPTTGLEGSAFDWQTKVLGSDNIIPANANRIAFGNDTSAVYLQYKRYIDGVWQYHFVPSIKRDVPKGTVVSFVTGGRTVTATDPSIPTVETFTAIVTLFDLLDTIKQTSVLLDVSGVVAYDRSPGGQAAKELLARTDAHVEPSTGTGSAAAKGFEATFANANAATELVTATCTAITSKDHPLARLGAERWQLDGSVSGDLGVIVTDTDFTDPGGKFGLRVPLKLPASYGQMTGRFDVVDVIYVPRTLPAVAPPICVVSKTLGSEAVDQTITLTYTARPSGACVCSGMPAPRLDPRCLGILNTEGVTVGYQADTIARLVALYDWQSDTFRTLSSQSADVSIEDTAIWGPQTPAAVMVPYYRSLKEHVAEFEATLAEIDPVADNYLRLAGNAAWDAAVAKFQYDVASWMADGDLWSVPSDRYTALCQWALISAGISPLGKTDASIVSSGDGCWRDYGDAFYWEAVGSSGGKYAPAFNNHPYYSSRRASDEAKYFRTNEFGFQINVFCPLELLEGDQIILSIGSAGFGATYQIGDELTLPIIAAQPLQLAGGQNGNAILDWYVTGSVAGALPNFTFDPAYPAPYSSGGLGFTYTPGGIPNAAGDRFTFAIEGGHFRWRKNAGVWIVNAAPLDQIPVGPVAFDSGLTIEFIPGASPSFVVSDTFSFRVLQPWAVANLTVPDPERWQWVGAAPTVIIDFGSPQPVNTIAFARHTLPSGTTILVELGTAAGVYPFSETPTWLAGEIVHPMAIERIARYARITLGAATAGGIGWVWMGDAFATSLSGEFSKRRTYKVNASSAGLDQGGKYLGRSVSGEILWTEAALTDADVAGIESMLDWLKVQDDEPLIVVPNIGRPDEAYLQRIAVDDVDFEELSDYNRDVAYERRYSVRLPLAGVWGG